jgi:hypothetical protein
MASKKKAVAEKPQKQYYKVVDLKHGHNGFFYKVGLNVDPHPRPLNQMDSCEPGALYFVEAKYLHDWSSKGMHIAWVTPVTQAQKDGEKWRAHEIHISKILPVEEAIPLIPDIHFEAYSAFDIDVSLEVLLKKINNVVHVADYLTDKGDTENLVKLLALYPTHKKLLAYVKKYTIHWGAEDVEGLVKLGFTHLISSDTIQDLFYAKEFKLLEKIASYLPVKKFIQVLWEIM